MAKGFSYRGQRSEDFPLILLSHTVNPPDVREYEEEIDGADGVLDFGTKFGKRAIELEVQLEASDEEELDLMVSRLMAWFSPLGAAGELFLDAVPNRTFFAKYSGKLGIVPSGRFGVFTIPLKCTDPYAYADANAYDKSYLYDTGLQYNTGLIHPNPEAFDWLYESQWSSLYNYSPIPSPLIVTIVGDVENLSITSQETGETITIETALAGQSLVIDGDKKTVTIDGVNAIASMSGDFLQLQAGANGLLFAGTNPNATVTYGWQHKFI